MGNLVFWWLYDYIDDYMIIWTFADVFHPWYDCQNNIDIKFRNYSGNV